MKTLLAVLLPPVIDFAAISESIIAGRLEMRRGREINDGRY